MIKYGLIVLLLCFSITKGYSQFTTQQYRQEISSLKDAKDFWNYWKNLERIDQEILLKTPASNKIEYDSISTSLMIRTILINEIHGAKPFKSNDLLPILSHAHNKIADLSLNFWPIIDVCVKDGKYITSIGGGYPAYQLEALSYNFYDYSLFGQKDIYPELLARIKALPKSASVDVFEKIYKVQKHLEQLEVKEIIGEWYQQTFKDEPKDSYFQIYIMSDEQWYLKRNGYLHKLKVTTKNNELVLKIDGEPFGWYYALGESKALKLFNKEQELLIAYSKLL